MRPIDLLKLTETNDFLDNVIFNKVTDLLKKYNKFDGFNDNNGFVNLFNDNCLLTGSTMIEFLLDEKYPYSNIDIFTNTLDARRTMIEYLFSQGYSYSQNESDNGSEDSGSEDSGSEDSGSESEVGSEEENSIDLENELFENDNNIDSGYSDIDNRFEDRFGAPEEIETIPLSDTESNYYRENAIEQRLNRSPLSYSDISSPDSNDSDISNNETILNESSSESESSSGYESDSETDETFEISTLYKNNAPNIKIVFKEITIDDYIKTIDLDICKNYFSANIAYSQDLFNKKSEIKISHVYESANRIAKYIDRGFEFKLIK